MLKESINNMINKYDNYYVIEDGDKKIFMPNSSAVFIEQGATVVRNTGSRKNVALVLGEEDPR